MRKLLFFAIGLAAGLTTWSVTARLAPNQATVFAQGAEQTAAPRYDSHGALLRPEHFETWIFVGSSTGLTYEPGIGTAPGEFHDVYIRPESYREYVRTGKFPEKTVLVLALYPPEDKVSPAKGGHFEGDLDGMAAAVKDHSHFAEGWAYFNFGRAPNLQAEATANPKQACYSCHSQHAADDNVFVQFYPILRPIMASHRRSSRP
ncbi:MAG TPA: cytochrome P460 family protein [Candidatus Acidoferrales bacterium]|nr:cytochrome P460 family protein [Candidatus Acidoferrales bacterium]